ncbi:MAG: DNA translocase FtsK, partial [Eubacterium sp.]|nr:DNA translocase FtsK [Eubacterium sp.]
MTKRYQLFEKYNVRNIEGFNKKVKTESPNDDPQFRHLPQIVVIVDELADLMMVAHKEVEDSIVRLCQLARAAGIHLIIATQRPSVDVITGLIKANVPSRIALSVSSAVDSRTIIDMNGAEKLLGNGDMLFYPTGYTKPIRVQGAYLSDDEILSVVNFIKSNYGETTYDETISQSIESSGAGGSSSDSGDSSGDGDRYDEYFEDAARFVIEKDRASIGYLQRMLRIGFNRAARIMDQLEEFGVVGPEEGTKPRKILMNITEFEEAIGG